MHLFRPSFLYRVMRDQTGSETCGESWCVRSRNRTNWEKELLMFFFFPMGAGQCFTKRTQLIWFTCNRDVVSCEASGLLKQSYLRTVGSGIPGSAPRLKPAEEEEKEEVNEMWTKLTECTQYLAEVKLHMEMIVTHSTTSRKTVRD